MGKPSSASGGLSRPAALLTRLWFRTRKSQRSGRGRRGSKRSQNGQLKLQKMAPPSPQRRRPLPIERPRHSSDSDGPCSPLYPIVVQVQDHCFHQRAAASCGFLARPRAATRGPSAARPRLLRPVRQHARDASAAAASSAAGAGVSRSSRPGPFCDSPFSNTLSSCSTNAGSEAAGAGAGEGAGAGATFSPKLGRPNFTLPFSWAREAQPPKCGCSDVLPAALARDTSATSRHSLPLCVQQRIRRIGGQRAPAAAAAAGDSSLPSSFGGDTPPVETGSSELVAPAAAGSGGGLAGQEAPTSDGATARARYDAALRKFKRLEEAYRAAGAPGAAGAPYDRRRSASGVLSPRPGPATPPPPPPSPRRQWREARAATYRPAARESGVPGARPAGAALPGTASPGATAPGPALPNSSFGSNFCQNGGASCGSAPRRVKSRSSSPRGALLALLEHAPLSRWYLASAPPR